MIRPSEHHVGERVGHGKALNGVEGKVRVLIGGGGDFGGGVIYAEAVGT